MPMKLTRNLTLTLLAVVLFSANAMAQNKTTALTGQTKNYISTGMPIMLVAPDAVSGALGDAGVAAKPSAYSAHWNNAQFAFIEDDFGVSTTYTPWLRNLGVADMNLLYLGGFGHINKRMTLAASLTYFSLGEIESRDAEGQSRGSMKPNEFAFDVSYALQLSDEFSMGATVRYLRSDLTNGQDISDGSGYVTTKPGNSIAADLGFYWQHELDKHQEMAVGLFMSNMGAKLSYSDDDTKKEFLPTNLRIGLRYTNEIDEANAISLLFDINKLMVPTPPKTVGDSTYSKYYRNMTEYYQTGVMKGMIQSFYDAPGGFGEELRELQLSGGAEYWYKQTIAARLGYFYEHDTKGGRQYATVGFGLRFNIFEADFAYLIPTTTFGSNPLSNTIRISLTLHFKKEKK